MRLKFAHDTKPGEPDVANESTAIAKGKDGKLAFRVELRIPKRPKKEYKVVLTYLGEPPGVQRGDPRQLWTAPISEAVLRVAD